MVRYIQTRYEEVTTDAKFCRTHIDPRVLTTPENTVVYHNALCLSSQNFAWALSSETEDNAYAKFWADKQRALWYVMVLSGVVNWPTPESHTFPWILHELGWLTVKELLRSRNTTMI